MTLPSKLNNGPPESPPSSRQSVRRVECRLLMMRPSLDLTPLRNLTSLRQIDLYFAPISPDLSALAKLVNLESLKIGKPLKNKDGGIKDLSPLTGLKNLKELNLRGNKIPDDQKEMLKKALPNCKIQF